MNLETTYLGLKLAHPFMPGASPLADDLDHARQLEDAGAPAIVMRSLFEEQIEREVAAVDAHVYRHAEGYAEARTFFPDPTVFMMGPDRYLEQLRKLRASLAIPVIASLNGTSPGGWLSFAKNIEQAGANALELNLYAVPTYPDEDAMSVEARAIEVVSAVRAAIRIPLAVKLSPFYSSLPNFARKLESAGANGLVLFNRFYQPDIDPEALDVKRSLHLSDSSELLLRLRWLAVLSGQRNLSLAASGGVHTPLDAIKAVMAGAHAVQMVSALLLHGPERLREIMTGVKAFLEEHEYESLDQMRGNMNLSRCPDPSGYERANYAEILQSWHGRGG
ncbi:MAG: dihydroorotate dehydrogenase-like protein [Polyangiaceae bacterium]|nr:dihydroorotate dehydrogenase-like protein [Polyangiaceae bacterium]